MFHRNKHTWCGSALLGALPVSCLQAVYREGQFGALDGVNNFFADGVEAFLVAVVPFLSQA